VSFKKGLIANRHAHGFGGNPISGTKETFDLAKRDLTHKPPAPDMSAQDAMLAQQREQQATLDSEENRRRKRLLSAAQGARAYRGSPLFRAPPSNTAGASAAAVPAFIARPGAGGAAGAGGGSAGSFVRRSFLM
jgi:hypothetical protein